MDSQKKVLVITFAVAAALLIVLVALSLMRAMVTGMRH
jgi:hypothetical protein